MLQRTNISFSCIQIGDFVACISIVNNEVYVGKVIEKNIIDEYIVLDVYPDDMLDDGFYNFELIAEGDYDLGV